MIYTAEMEVGNSVDIEISMAEQVDSDDDADLLDDLGIPNLAQLLIPASSNKTPRTDGGQRLAAPPSAAQSHALAILLEVLALSRYN